MYDAIRCKHATMLLQQTAECSDIGFLLTLIEEVTRLEPATTAAECCLCFLIELPGEATDVDVSCSAPAPTAIA
jgi:hypothetical protein